MRHYIQVGAGIDSMVRCVQRLEIKPGMSLLDVGCGVGFTVSFWNWAKGKGHGLEPSAYGRLGAEILDTSVIPAYLSEAPQLNGQKFDRVFSSEVIEHVNDTASFLMDLKSVTSDKGVLVLTTPNALFIDPYQPHGTVVAALSAGFHRLLFSKQALESSLQVAGFKNFIVMELNERLIAYASDQKIDYIEHPEVEQLAYISYLRETAAAKSNSDLKIGLLFRAFKELVNNGSFDEAVDIGQEIRLLVQKDFGLDLLDVKNVHDSLKKASTFEEFGQIAPYFTPVFLFYAAMLTLNGKPFLQDPHSGFEVSVALCSFGVSMVPSLFQEAGSIYWIGKLHVAISAIRTGDHTVAKIVLQAILDGKSDISIVRDDIIFLRAMREMGVVLLQTGDPERAMGLFRTVAERSQDLRADVLDLYSVAQKESFARISIWV